MVTVMIQLSGCWWIHNILHNEFKFNKTEQDVKERIYKNVSPDYFYKKL